MVGYRTPPSVVPRLLHAAAVESVHEEDTLTSPEEQLRSWLVAVKPAVRHDDVSDTQLHK